MNYPLSPLREYRVKGYIYALWENRFFYLSDHKYIIDVVKIKTKSFMFWKWQKIEIIAIFKIKYTKH